MVIATWFASIDEQLATPTACDTQPSTAPATKLSVPGSCVVQAVVVQARVYTIVPVKLAVTGVKLVVVLLVFETVTVMVFV
jgi:hypothetical protein